MKYKFLNIALTVLLSALICIILYLALKPNQDDYFAPIEETSSNADVDLSAWLSGIPKDSILFSFPYRRYTSKVEISDINAINRDIQILDTLSGDHYTSLSIFLLAYTDSLLPQLQTKLKEFNADTLSKLLMGIEGYKHYAKLPGANQDFYGGMYHYWMDEISNRLDKYSKVDPNLKYNFKFRYLSEKCNENNYVVAPKVTESEKIVNNIADSKWSYLYKRIWSTTVAKRILFFSIFILTILAYISLSKTFFTKFKK
jgi:hypothetical protein